MSSWKGSVPRVLTTPDLSSTSNLPPAAAEDHERRKRRLILTSVPHKEVVEVVVGVRVLGLQGEHRGVGGSVELHHGLHGQRPVDEVRRLVVDVLHFDDDSLVVGV